MRRGLDCVAMARVARLAIIVFAAATCMPGLSPAAAEKAATALLDPSSGIYRDLHIDGAGLRHVLALRSKYALPHKELTDPSRYVDPSIAQAAIGSPNDRPDSRDPTRIQMRAT